MNLEYIQAILPALLKGTWQTLQVFFLTLVLSLPLGLPFALGSISRFFPVRFLSKAYIWVFRGTPLMLQLFVVMYMPGLVFGIPMKSRMTAVLIAFVINYAAYFSEIYRGGIESIPKGQYEAGQVLGMTRSQVFFRVVLLQVVKRITPPMSNEVITLVKDTALARVVSVAEIIMCAERYTKQGLIWPLFSTGLFFLLFNGVLTLLFGYFEKKMDYFKG